MDVPFWDVDEGYEGPLYQENPWDLVILNGFRTPGVASVKCTPKLKIDLPKTVSKDGGPAIERGHVPATIEITIKVWTRPQWEALEELITAIWRRPGEPFRQESHDGVTSLSVTTGVGKDKAGKKIPVTTAKPAISVSHPVTAFYGVVAMMLETLDGPEPAPEVGAKQLRLRGVQYIPPSNRKAVKKAAGAGVKLTPEFKQAHNATPPSPPSKTDAVPRPAPKPNTGGS